MTTKRFTGQYHEASLPGGEGLSYYNARWYDAQLGRFLSADPIVPDPANPQAFNRYSYVFNNPLNYIDPTGHLPISDTRFLYDDGGSITNGGGSSRPFVQYLVSYQGLFGTTRRTYRFYTDSTWNWNNITTGMRFLWDVSFFSAPSRDLDYAYGAWQAWGQRNVQRLPEPLRTVAGMVNDPFVQEVLLATISVPGGAAGSTAAVRMANPGQLRFWKAGTAFDGTKVFQRDEWINPNLIDATGQSNLQRMKGGRPPVGPDGEGIVLHHITQMSDGPLVELTTTMHRQNSRMLHINPNTIPSGINRREFDKWRREYWINRAKDFE